jgi:predicted NBD/HSP70 family sugar kinase
VRPSRSSQAQQKGPGGAGLASNGAGSLGQGSTSAQIGDFNERVVLSSLRRLGPASKAELARRIGLTSNAAGVIVRKLEEGGLVRSVGKRYGGRGQPATVLELNPEGAYAVGVRIDRDMIETVLVDVTGAVLDRVVIDGLPPPQDAVAALASHVRAFRRHLGPDAAGRLSGLGVAMPYNLGSWLDNLDLPDAVLRRWDGFDLQAELAAATHLAVVVENDGSAAAVGELLHGHGRELDDFLYLFIGPAIGGGVVLGGNYLRGRHANAGDFAVVPVAPSQLASAPPADGRAQPLIARASLAVLARHLRHAGGRVRSTLDLDGAIEAAPRAYAEWLDDAADALAWPVLTGAHILDVAHVIVAGDLPREHLEPLVARLSERCAASVAESRRPPEIRVGAVGRDAGAVGAASLPVHVSYSPMRELLTGDAPDAFLEVLS